MQYDIRMYKIVCGDTIIGNYNSESKQLQEVMIIQTIPSASGIQLALLPYGFPYEEEIKGNIDEKHFIYEFKKIPEDIKNKYLEAKSNIKLPSSSMGGGKSGIIL